ncbi:hypothetical protein NE236_29745 [Actinoallomurus purpureus]|uniref:hypothetical protein n=1 Tax=Actinoallomurus purpureus TaxID=478114 RepID=UPI002092E6A4|nr:hypothetical protein [Actinoallomurus purpureus]MCO6009161.1 hypothetical protein [Actinoallomurus purpureus]
MRKGMIQIIVGGILVAVVVTVVVLLGFGGSGHGHQDTPHTQPTPTYITHTFYGVDRNDPVQQEVLTWTSKGDKGPIDGTLMLKERANGSADWKPVWDQPRSFQGTQNGDQIEIPASYFEIPGLDMVKGTIDSHGRLHLNVDLAVQTEVLTSTSR